MESISKGDGTGDCGPIRAGGQVHVRDPELAKSSAFWEFPYISKKLLGAAPRSYGLSEMIVLQITSRCTNTPRDLGFDGGSAFAANANFGSAKHRVNEHKRTKYQTYPSPCQLTFVGRPHAQ